MSAAGSTRWTRFGVSMLISTAVAAAVLVSLSQGALAASLSVSGVPFTVTADELDASGGVQYGSTENGPNGPKPVLISAFRSATLTNFCQSFTIDLPLGAATVRLTAPGRGGMSADNLVIGVEGINGNLTMTNVELGVDAGQLDRGPKDAQGAPGAFGIQADGMRITNLRQTAVFTTASTMRLNQLTIAVVPGRHGCAQS